MDCRIKSGNDEMRRLVTFSLTLVAIYVTRLANLAYRGTPFARALSKDGASAVPAGGGYALRSRAALGHRSAGMMTGLRGAR
jgi:hypothetical protein